MTFHKLPQQRFEALQPFLLPVVLVVMVVLLWVAYARPFRGASISPPDLSRSGFSFVPNAGQSDSAVRFMTHDQGMSLFFTDEGVTFLGMDGEMVRWEFMGAETAEIQGANTLPGVANYLNGSDPSQWQTGLPTYGMIQYDGIYPGVDATFNGRPGQLEAAFQLEPGTASSVLQWRFEGMAARLNAETGGLDLVDGDGRLMIAFERPMVQQQNGNTAASVAADFVVDEKGNVAVGVGAYDQTKPLTIFLATKPDGGVPAGIDEAWGVVSTPALETFVTGNTSSRVFPLVAPLQDHIAGNRDVFITKFSVDGEVLFSTYLGGSDNDYGRGAGVDSAGNVVLTGYTESSDFPSANPIIGDQPGRDAFVSKISADGSQLLFSTYLGGGGDDFGSDVTLDAQDNMYIVGSTLSTNFPLLNPIQATYGGNRDAFISKISGNSYQMLFSTYLGGSNLDVGAGVDLDQNGEIFIAGSTASADFPTANMKRLQVEAGLDNRDVYVAKLPADGSSLLFSTLFGGADDDGGNDVSVDPLGNAFVVGETKSFDFPLVAPIQAVMGGNSDVFVTQVAGDGGSLLFSTFLGGNLDDSGRGIVVGEGGNVFVTGQTWSNDFPILNPLPGMGYPGRGDAFVLRHSMDGVLAWSTYLGGTDYDTSNAIDVDDEGRPVVVGLTTSDDFPTANAFQTTLQLGWDGFVGRLNHTGQSLQFSTYLGGDNSYPFPTDVTLSEFGESAEPNLATYLLALGLLGLLVVGVWWEKRARNRR
ncbi:MAG: SBBP repeat-containing protein [Candidatus Promineifilaceae bacterium]